MYDIAIIGAGPAGLSAAITARSRNQQVLVLSNPLAASPLARSQRVDNYPGMPEVSGLCLLQTMYAQAEKLGAEIREGRVVSVLPFGQQFALTSGTEDYQAATVILALGIAAAESFPGEAEFLGRGVSYCATCDGMLFRGRRIAVIGLNSEAISEATFLQGIGCEVVYLAPKADSELMKLDVGIERRVGKVTAITGDGKGVTAIEFIDAADQAAVQVDVAGVFILRPAIAPDALLPGLALDGAYIKVEKDMATSVKGVFAAGDCVGKPLQIAKAVGQGQLAGFAAVDYLGNTNTA
ncbi:MAG: FAD-dependent oxidoreductase [Actinomycetia bacterium]|nr:FAD-dependent oxidoreductase [Actinomycetes bacterium]